MKTTILIVCVAVLGFLPLSARAFSLGESANFYIDSSFDPAGRSQISAVLKNIGNSAYFYIDSNWWSGLSSSEQVQKLNDLNRISREFDGTIYPTLRNVFGTEWRPGIDNDERITILITPMPEKVGGYFNPSDEYSRSKIQNSNEREMVYFNALNLSGSLAPAFIAQEFQHLISFYQKDKLQGVSEEVWLNELRSEMAVTLCGYDRELGGSNLEMRIKNFLDKPYDSLTEWQNTPNDYGVINLFGHYLTDQYGIEVLTESMKNPQNGIESLNKALKKLGYNKDFSQIFIDWTIASYVDDCSLGQYFCYKSDNLKNFKVTPLVNFIPFVGTSQFSVVNTTKDWAGNWYKFSGGHDALKIEFTGPLGAGMKIPYVVTDINGKNSLNYFSLDIWQKGTIYVPDFGTKNISLVIIPSIQKKISDFSGNEPSYQISWTATTIKNSEIPAENSSASILIPDGSLVRAKGDYKVYVVGGQYRRWIQSPEIFNFYGHLKWENVIEASIGQLLDFEESFLVREKDDYKVYKIENGKKRWLNMTAQNFEVNGYKWDEIFIINQKERDYFPTGASILK